jgi:HTH-type transcriptional regulator, sugar sensing transcriptional regulator
MDSKLLQEIGLTEGETKVYLALLRLGQTKTGPLAKKAEVSSSKVYKILDRLVNKGLANHVIKGKIKYFSALEPERIIDYIDDNEKKLEEKKELIRKMLPELKLEANISAEKQSAFVYEGFKAVTNFFRNILVELKPEEEYYVISGNYGEVPGLRPFLHNHHKQRAEMKIKVKMLANHDLKGHVEKTTFKNSEVRYLPAYLMTNMQILFYKSKAFIIVWSKEPVGFLIINKEAVAGFKNYFDVFWKIASK